MTLEALGNAVVYFAIGTNRNTKIISYSFRLPNYDDIRF